MNNSELFKAAHKAAKEIKSIVGDYGIAFSLSLKKIYADIRSFTDLYVEGKKAADSRISVLNFLDEKVQLTEGESKVYLQICEADEFDGMPAESFANLCDYMEFSKNQIRVFLRSLREKHVLNEGEFPNGMKAFFPYDPSYH